MLASRHLLRSIYLPVALYAAILLLPLLDNGTVLSRHEVLAAEPAREMLEGTGSWAVQTFAGEFRTAKPPTMSWLIAFSMFVLQSQSEFACRLPAALAGIVTATATAYIAVQLTRRAGAGLLAGLITVTLFWFQMQARLAEADMPLVAACTVAMAGVCPRRRQAMAASSRATLLGAIVFYGATGAGFMLKGVAPLVTIPAAILFAVWARDRTTWRVLRNPIGIALFAILLIAWPLAAYRADPNILHDWRRQTVDRSLGQMDEADRGSITPLIYMRDLPFYFWMTPLLLLPATPALAIGVWSLRRRKGLSPLPQQRERVRVRAERDDGDADLIDRSINQRVVSRPADHPTALTLALSHEYTGEGTRAAVIKFLLAWIIPFFLLLTLSAWKHKHYVLPILPPFSIVAAYGTLVWAASLPRPAVARRLLVAWFAGAGVVILFAQAFVLPRFDGYRPDAELAWRANQLLPAGAHATLVGLGEAHIAFYLQPIADRIDDPQTVPTDRTIYAVCTAATAESLSRDHNTRPLAEARFHAREQPRDRLVLIQVNP